MLRMSWEPSPIGHSHYGCARYAIEIRIAVLFNLIPFFFSVYVQDETITFDETVSTMDMLLGAGIESVSIHVISNRRLNM